MGVYIKSMEMPKTCGKCQIKNAIECNRWKLVRSVVLDRHKDCPLIPVPPHGRLIDADKIYDAVEQRYRISSGIEHRCERDLLDLICSAPTVIKAEEGDK